MKCPNCKNPIDDNAIVCEWCGYRVQKIDNDKTEFNVILRSFDSTKKIAIIKEVRAITALGLIEAKDLVEGAPTLLSKCFLKEDAIKIKDRINAVGGIAEIPENEYKYWREIGFSNTNRRNGCLGVFLIFPLLGLIWLIFANIF
jgi:ribosomal protein L7/L12